jgi:tRNA pseudouridine55 synthase
MKVYNIYKKIGETPLEALEKFRKQKKIASSARLTYIGRLDPMASGVLLILEGATQADREKYMGLDKEYRVQVLFGFETDSFDLLGIPKSSKQTAVSSKQIQQELKNYQGLIKLPIPPYSSVPYKGKPLFQWARANRLKNIRLPVREFKVKSVKLKGLRWITSSQLIKYIETNIKKVKGDFRQEKILKTWKKMLSESDAQYPMSNILISVSSGTYIRSIAHDLGKKLKTGAVVFSLERTKVGKFKNQD